MNEDTEMLLTNMIEAEIIEIIETGEIEIEMVPDTGDIKKIETLIETIIEAMIEVRKMTKVGTMTDIEIMEEAPTTDIAAAGGNPEKVARRLCAIGSLLKVSPPLQCSGTLHCMTGIILTA